MNNLLHFKASSNIKSLVGKDLVTDEVAAIFELVKNSYDADAEEVRIEFHNLKSDKGKLIISDTGIGMDLKDIQEKWMVIGTDSKKKKGYSEKYQRPLNGDKGIGRFSVDRLGRSLKLKTIKENSFEIVEMHFDWTLFDDKYSNLEDISFPYEVTKVKENLKGVVLEISELRDEWNREKIDLLIKNLRHFKSPFKINDNFRILVSAPEYFSGWKQIEPYNLADISPLWVKTEISENDLDVISISVYRDGIEYKEIHKNRFNFGPVYLEVYFFDKSAKIKFFNRMKMYVKDFGNIRLYRDDFRIHPYGEESNDWLELDRRKAQGIARFFGTRDLIGFVQITKEKNQRIEVLTNRQGLIENKYYHELRDFVVEYSIKMLEKYFFKKPENENFQKARENVKNAVLELKKVAQIVQKTDPTTAKVLRQVSEIVQKSQEEQVEFVKNQEELVKVLQRNADKELLLHKIIHEGLIRIERVKTVSSLARRKIRNKSNISFEELINLLDEKLEKIDTIASDAKEYLRTARDHIIRHREKENINLKNFIYEYIGAIREELIENNIKINIKVKENLQYKMDKEDLKTILNNLMSNSIKSLKKVNHEKGIWIDVTENRNFIILAFRDNGIGIPENLINRIFDPFYSTTEGFGMGLSIVDEIIKEYKGELNLGMNNDIGAEFYVKLRK